VACCAACDQSAIQFHGAVQHIALYNRANSFTDNFVSNQILSKEFIKKLLAIEHQKI